MTTKFAFLQHTKNSEAKTTGYWSVHRAPSVT